VETSPAEVTSLLNRLAEGNQEAATKLIPLVYEELRRLRHERPNHTLQATALVWQTVLSSMLWLRR